MTKDLNRYNIIIDSDSYKASHYLQYPPHTQYISSYIEARKGGKWNEAVFFGLQYYLKEYLSKQITQDDIDLAEEVITKHGEPFNKAGWQYILDKHDGYLPVRIEAVKEGTVVPCSNVLVQVVNTDPECYWLTSYIETSLLRNVWYGTTVATNSYQCKRLINDGLLRSSDNPGAELLFKLHDFGSRGITSAEQAGIGGVAHLVNFMGTDTMNSLLYASKYYGEDMAGYSIPASEHSSITSWGGPENEYLAFKNMLDTFLKKDKIVACVSDSFDIEHACKELWGTMFKDQIVNSGGTLVVRPDSGDPIETPVQCVEWLMEKFGYTLNHKGYKVLPSCIRVIQGDGINHTSLEMIIERMLQRGLSMSNLGFGMGGGLLQQVNRDTLSFAMKCSSITTNSGEHDVYKKPKTMSTKNSKRGVLALVKNGNTYETIRKEELDGRTNLLEVVFENGHILRDQTLKEIRELAKI
jgi:nicotinamide phosphoribosyltransferase